MISFSLRRSQILLYFAGIDLEDAGFDEIISFRNCSFENISFLKGGKSQKGVFLAIPQK